MARAEHGQIIVAQAIGDCLAVMALQKREHRRVGRIEPGMAAAVEELRFELKILEIRRRGIVGNLRREPRGFRRVVVAGSLAQLHEDLIVGQCRGRSGMTPGRRRAARDECRGGQGGASRAIYSNKAFRHHVEWSKN